MVTEARAVDKFIFEDVCNKRKDRETAPKYGSETELKVKLEIVTMDSELHSLDAD